VDKAKLLRAEPNNISEFIFLLSLEFIAMGCKLRHKLILSPTVALLLDQKVFSFLFFFFFFLV
jgi:hypothetical protein